MSKYIIVKDKSGKSKKVIVEGVKKVLYKKDGSRKMYVVSKGKMMQLTKYKEMKKKKGNVKKVKKRGGVDLPRVLETRPSNKPRVLKTRVPSFPSVTGDPIKPNTLAEKYTQKDFLDKLRELETSRDILVSELKDSNNKEILLQLSDLESQINKFNENFNFMKANTSEKADPNAVVLYKELPSNNGIVRGGKKKNKNKPKKVSRKKTRTKK